VSRLTDSPAPVGAEMAPAAATTPSQEPPTWTRWQEIPRVVGHPPFLKRTAGIAFVVGTILFAINHLDDVIRGQATILIWIKGAATYLVPFCVANIGVLVGARREL
jgi:hypothetical protein